MKAWNEIILRLFVWLGGQIYLAGLDFKVVADLVEHRLKNFQFVVKQFVQLTH